MIGYRSGQDGSARWSHLARLGLPAVSRKQNFPKSHIINPLLTKFFGQDGWILASFFFCKFMDLDFVLAHKHAKKELGQYPAILTSHLVNNPYILTEQTWSIKDIKLQREIWGEFTDMRCTQLACHVLVHNLASFKLTSQNPS